MTTQSITSITDGQKKQYLRFVEDAAERALKEVGLDKDGLQRLIEHGDEFQSHIITGIRKSSGTKTPVRYEGSLYDPRPARGWFDEDLPYQFVVVTDRAAPHLLGTTIRVVGTTDEARELPFEDGSCVLFELEDGGDHYAARLCGFQTR
jgi:hypothetical protein